MYIQSVSSLEYSFHAEASTLDILLNGIVCQVRITDIDSRNLWLLHQADHLWQLFGHHWRVRIARVPLQDELLLLLLRMLLLLRHCAIGRVLQSLHRCRMLGLLDGVGTRVVICQLHLVHLPILSHRVFELLRHKRVVRVRGIRRRYRLVVHTRVVSALHATRCILARTIKPEIL